MPKERFYTPHLNTPEVSLSGPENHHLTHVMRIKAGESVELIDGKGTLATARVKTPGKETSLLEISTSIQATPSKELILAQALPRPNLLDWILEKGTELGATQFWLFPGELSEKKELSAHQLQRLTTLTIAAMKQSGRLFLPQIHLKPALAKWPSLPGQVFYGDTRSSAPKLTCNPQDPITFFIGPEKGFSSKEIDHLEQTLKAKGVKLHDNILRTETAGLVALSQISLAKCAKVDSSLT